MQDYRAVQPGAGGLRGGQDQPAQGPGREEAQSGQYLHLLTSISSFVNVRFLFANPCNV